ncbi:ATP-binding protein [Imperialibacter roseus]|uniref:histidine kinase n=1 Tax=Imperialibacter roseus TaxID=1324217 RepID=A0ABZ0IPU2_9BACT|nr:ATP-binding protein [Imperialibacter roseus]WOK06194.1 ATP-binding protein [Imperialibacter roseus]
MTNYQHRSSISILLIDDDEEDFLITRDIIADFPSGAYTLAWEPDFEKAKVKILQNEHEAYLVDFRLGAESGLDLISYSLERGIMGPFILLTGQGDLQIDEEARRLGAVDYMVKGSINPDQLERSIRYGIQHVLNLNEIKELNQQLERRVMERTRDLARANERLSYSNESLQKEVDERKQAEKALRESQKIYSAIASNFPDGMLCVLDKDLRFLLVDGKAEEPEMRNKQEWIGSYASSMTFIDQKEAFIKNLKKVLKGVPLNMEVTVANGEREYQINAVPLFDDEEKIQNLLIVCKNITERKKAEKEVLRALNQEKELNELKSRFVTTASHEFRTPLSTILSSVSLIGRYISDSDQKEKIDKHVHRIKSSVNNLTYILNDFLSLGKLEEGKTTFNPVSFDLEQMISEVVSQISPTLKEDQDILLSIAEGTFGEIYVDEQMTKNILINLLNNASKYSGERQKIHLGLGRENGLLKITVKDEGIGIPKKDQQHLFDRFFRANNAINIQGTGLGLNIVKKYIELMNGHIEFSSEENKGTEFRVAIPITQPSYD